MFIKLHAIFTNFILIESLLFGISDNHLLNSVQATTVSPIPATAQTTEVNKEDIKGIMIYPNGQEYTFYGIPTNKIFTTINNGSFFAMLIMIVLGLYVSKIFEKYLTKLIIAVEGSMKENQRMIDILEGGIEKHGRLQDMIEKNADQITKISVDFEIMRLRERDKEGNQK